MRANGTVQYRPLDGRRDAGAVRALVDAEVSGTPYREIPLRMLEEALDGGEAQAVVAQAEEGVCGVVIYGWVAGAVRTGRLHLVAVTASARLQGVGKRLCEIAIDDLFARGARMVVAELPDDPVIRPGRLLLDHCGLREEARIPDYYREGVALVVLRCDAEGRASG